jgi:CheY-like chemotaxis protein
MPQDHDHNLKIVLGAAIRNERLVRGISQEELAYRAGLHRTYVSDVERGTRNPSIESIAKLARALDLSVSALFARVDKGNEPRQVVEILLVEDNPADADLTIQAFKKANITNPMHVVRDGVEALDFLFATGRYANRKEDPYPKVVLLDLNLPKKSGLEVLQNIRADERTKGIPVVTLTSSRHGREIAECRRLGVETYIVKPVGFQNFSEVTPYLSLGWTLVKPIQMDTKAA